VIYFLSIAWAVHVLALRQNINVVIEEKVDVGIIKRRFPVFVIPLGLIIALLVMDYSPTFAAFWATMTILALSTVRKETRLSWGDLVKGFRTGCVAASRLAMAIATVGVLYSMLSLTGVGMEVAYTVEEWSLGIPFIAIFVCMCVTILLGCGMPIPAAYALVAIVVAPVLVRLGLVPLRVHFFVFYFAAVSNLSPPVAGTALMASSISGGSYFRTGIESMKLAAPAFIIPWLFLFNPNLLGNFSGLFDAIASVLAAMALVFALQAGLFGQLLMRLNTVSRISFMTISAILIAYEVTQNALLFVIGVVLFIPMLLHQIVARSRSQWERKSDTYQAQELA
jgi:TRAP-type uncharacterized transport system fused permease subunit